MGATGILNALELASGKRLWSRDVVRETGAAIPEWGRSCSPLVVDGRVVVIAGGSAAAGSWPTTRRAASPPGPRAKAAPSYSSPTLLTLAGRPQVVVLNSGASAGTIPRPAPCCGSSPSPASSRTSRMPLLLAPDRLLVSAGYGVGSKAYRVSDERRALRATLEWESPRLKSKFANLLLHGGFVYGLDDGVLTCLDPANGERRWKSGRHGHGQLLLVAGLLLVQTEEGELVLVDPSPDAYRELTRFAALDGKTWNPPALAGHCCWCATTARPPPSSCPSSSRLEAQLFSGGRSRARRGPSPRTAALESPSRSRSPASRTRCS